MSAHPPPTPRPAAEPPPAAATIPSAAAAPSVPPVQPFHGAVTRDVAAWTEIDRRLAALADRVWRPINDEVAGAAAAHRRIVEELSGLALGDHGARWRRARRYRRETTADVIDRLRRVLSVSRLAASVATAWREVYDAAVETGVDDLPEAVVVPEEAEVFDLADDDPPLRAGRKWMARTHRRVFPKGRQRSVAVRRLVAYHLRVRVVAALDAVVDERYRRVAEALATAEDALTDWTHAAIGLEVALDRPTHHQPESLRHLDPDDLSDPIEPSTDTFDTVTRELQAALDALSLPTEAPDTRVVRLAAVAELEDDLRCAGTFLAKPRIAPPAEERPTRAIDDWNPWLEQVANRLTLFCEILRVRQEAEAIHERLLDRIGGVTVLPVHGTIGPFVDRLRIARADVDRLCDTDGPRAALAEPIAAIRDRLVEAAADAFRRPPVVAANEVLVEPGASEAEEIARLIESLSEETQIHRLPDDGPAPIEPGRRPTTVRLREIAADAFSPPLPVQLRKAAQAMRAKVVTAWDEADRVGEIVEFNLTAAIEELETAPVDDADGEGESPVRQLAADGLDRAANTLKSVSASMGPAWHGFLEAVYEILTDDWKAFHRRLQSSAAVEEQWMGLRTRAKRRAEGWSAALGDRMAAWVPRIDRWRRATINRGRRLIERGRSAVGVAAEDRDSRVRVLAAIGEIETLRKSLPLIYRRLFSWEPVDEARLLEGRARDLVSVRQDVGGWTEKRVGGVIVAYAPLGSGRTGFLNVLEASAFSECEVVRVNLTSRLESPAEFAAVLGRAFGCRDAVDSLDRLEAYIRGRDPGGPPTVCLIDNLEHLLLRVPGGSDLIERALIFFAHTDAFVCWVATINEHAWHFVTRTAGPATRFVQARALAPITRAVQETIIVNRHARTGLELRFVDPPDPSPLLKRRLRRARDETQRQGLLKDAYFDRLYRWSGDSVVLATFYWLRSADFSTEGRVEIAPIEPLDFGFLSSLDIDAVFTLKAFVMHTTLALDEHNAIFRIDDERGTFIMESLLNLGLLEAVTDEGTTAVDDDRITRDSRYRIRPLFLHPVVEHLRAKHVVY